MSLLLSYFTFSQVQRPSQFIFKLLLCVIAINSTKALCFGAIFITSYLSSVIREIGESLFNIEICFSSLIQRLNSIVYFDDSTINFFSFSGLIKGLISIGLINLSISYALRYIMLKVFVLLCPFAILSLSIAKFSWFFKSWIRNFLSLLFLQVFVSLILLICFSLDFSNNNILSTLTQIGAIYALIKANTFLKDLMGGLSTDVSLSNIKSIFYGGL